MKRISLLAIAISCIIVISACASEKQYNASGSGDHSQQHSTNVITHDEHSDMNHSSSGELPVGLQAAAHPTFEVGSKVRMIANHMDGMEGANASIVGAFETTVYAVSFENVHNGKKVSNHKWVIHEEIANGQEASYKIGDKVELATEHMEGMNGAEAVIDSAEKSTVYMVSYMSSTGEQVNNHKWVTEDELKAL